MRPRLLAEVFGRHHSCDEVPGRITRQLAEQTLSTVLLGLEHHHSDEILRQVDPCRPASVTAAVDLITSETSACHAVTDLAHQVGVTVRGLELGFRKSMDTTPHEFLQQTRMAKAHRDLLAAAPGDGTTVTEVAMRWGFAHTGRFPARYRRCYGVMPSVTLRKGNPPIQA